MILQKLQTKNKEGSLKTSFTLKESVSNKNLYLLIQGLEQFKSSFIQPILWKSVEFDFSESIKMNYEIDIEGFVLVADLLSLKISRDFKKGTEVFNYVFNFEKELGKDDLNLSAFLNAKDEEGEIIDYRVGMVLINPKAQF